MTQPKKILLVVLDGFGLRAQREGNAVALAAKPNLDRFSQDFPLTHLQASGLSVGLPDGQMGNSEVGHTNIGAGRVVYQDLVRINLACERGELDDNEALRRACDHALEHRAPLHFMGLCSDGGIHSSQAHLIALVEMAARRGIRDVYIHAFTDGRDTPPKSAAAFIGAIEDELRRIGVGRVATVSGRFYAMDRDKRWDRIALAVQAMGFAGGPRASSATTAVAQAYDRGESDEFIVPTVIVDDAGHPIGQLAEGAVAVFFNFRPDRAREITRALALNDLPEHANPDLRLARFVCMTEYDDHFRLPVAFPSDSPQRILPEVLAERGMPQFRCAETEKYAHVTFFFNGGREAPFPREERVLVPSPREVKTYDLKPEMSAEGVTAEVLRRLETGAFPFLLVNYANPDMVGHTGKLDAAIKAVEVVDECLGRLYRAAAARRTAMIITADHGNCEMMIDPLTGGPHTQHTTNPVPMHLIDPDYQGCRLQTGILADVAATLLSMYGLEEPVEMTGNSLVIR
jgi:2,3-bisphosphoglycerate-independent phosphoglycerate mutase